MSDAFYPLRALAGLYCACEHHVDVHKPDEAGVLVCTGIDGRGRRCECPGFRPPKPREPER